MKVNQVIDDDKEAPNEYSSKPLRCRCGGIASAINRVDNCKDRWEIHCLVKRCHAQVYGQGKCSTLLGWNRLSLHLFR